MMWLFITVTVSLFVVFTNSIVLALICSLRRLQTLRNVPLAGLATADILVGLFWIPLATASTYRPKSQGLCRAALSFEILTMHASLFNLIAVSTERWIAIFKPLHYYQIASKAVVISLIGISWVLSFAMLMAFLLADKHENDITECDIVKYVEKWLLYMILAIFYIVCGIMMLMQLKVYLVVRNQLRKIRPIPKPGNITNGLLAATSFIIEKSFKIDNSTESNRHEAESQGSSTNRWHQPMACEEIEEEGNSRHFAREPKEQATIVMTERKTSKTLKNIRTKSTKLTMAKESEFARSESNKVGTNDAKQKHLDHQKGSCLTEITANVKVCIQRDNVSADENLRLISKVKIDNSFTSSSTRLQDDDLESVSEKSSNQHVAQIMIIENETMSQNEVNSAEDSGGTKSQSKGRMSRRERAYFRPDQERSGHRPDQEQSGQRDNPGAKKSFAPFAKMLSAIKKQKKMDVARSVATNMVCLCFVLMWVPKSTIDLLTNLGYCYNCSLAHSISAVLAWTNSGINALIYAWRMQEFNQAMRRILIRKTNRVTNN